MSKTLLDMTHDIELSRCHIKVVAENLDAYLELRGAKDSNTTAKIWDIMEHLGKIKDNMDYYYTELKKEIDE